MPKGTCKAGGPGVCVSSCSRKRARGGGTTWHDTDSLRAWHCLPPANLCKWRILTPGRWDVGGWVLSEFGWQPTACSKNGATAAVVVTAHGAGKFGRAPQERRAGTTYPLVAWQGGQRSDQSGARCLLYPGRMASPSRPSPRSRSSSPPRRSGCPGWFYKHFASRSISVLIRHCESDPSKTPSSLQL